MSEGFVGSQSTEVSSFSDGLAARMNRRALQPRVSFQDVMPVESDAQKVVRFSESCRPSHTIAKSAENNYVEILTHHMEGSMQTLMPYVIDNPEYVETNVSNKERCIIEAGANNGFRPLAINCNKYTTDDDGMSNDTDIISINTRDGRTTSSRSRHPVLIAQVQSNSRQTLSQTQTSLAMYAPHQLPTFYAGKNIDPRLSKLGITRNPSVIIENDPSSRVLHAVDEIVVQRYPSNASWCRTDTDCSSSSLSETLRHPRRIGVSSEQSNIFKSKRFILSKSPTLRRNYSTQTHQNETIDAQECARPTSREAKNTSKIPILQTKGNKLHSNRQGHHQRYEQTELENRKHPTHSYRGFASTDHLKGRYQRGINSPRLNLRRVVNHAHLARLAEPRVRSKKYASSQSGVSEESASDLHVAGPMSKDPQHNEMAITKPVGPRKSILKKTILFSTAQNNYFSTAQNDCYAMSDGAKPLLSARTDSTVSFYSTKSYLSDSEVMH